LQGATVPACSLQGYRAATVAAAQRGVSPGATAAWTQRLCEKLHCSFGFQMRLARYRAMALA
jgi:hypothetical protein